MYTDELDANHDDAPLRFHALDNILADAPLPGYAARATDNELHFTSAEEPASFREAEREACWRGAMLEEMKSITDNQTWNLVKLPPGHHAIGLK